MTKMEVGGMPLKIMPTIALVAVQIEIGLPFSMIGVRPGEGKTFFTF